MDKVTAEDLDAMTPDERSTAFDEAITTPEALPARYRTVLDSQDAEVRSQVRKAS